MDLELHTRSLRPARNPLNQTFSLASYIDRESRLFEPHKHNRTQCLSSTPRSWGSSMNDTNSNRASTSGRNGPSISSVVRQRHQKKKTFSEEVLELSRHEMVLTKTKTVDISLLPPKRFKLDVLSSPPQYNHNHCRNQSCCGMFECCSRLRKREDCQKRMALATRPAPLMLMENHKSEAGAGRIRYHSRPSFPPFTVARIIIKDEERSRAGSIFRSMLPWDLRTQENFQNYVSSDFSLLPVAIVETDRHVFVKILAVKNRRGACKRNLLQEKKLSAVSSFPSLFFPFKVIAGVINWVLGN